MTQNLSTFGFSTIPKALNTAQVDRLRLICMKVREQWLNCDPLTGLPSVQPGKETCMRHVNHPVYFKENHADLNEVLLACSNSTIVAFLEEHWREEAVFRSTALFFNPTDTSEEGHWHRDLQFVFADPAEQQLAISQASAIKGEELQVQVPLYYDDSLEYIPGSHHRWDTHEESEVRLGDGGACSCDSIAGSVRIGVSAGDALVFNPNGIHRGRYLSTHPRLTIMVTYSRVSIDPRLDRLSFQPWIRQPDYLSGLTPEHQGFYHRFLKHYADVWPTTSEPLPGYHSGRGS